MVGVVVMTVGLVMKLKRSMSKNQDGEKGPEITEQQTATENTPKDTQMPTEADKKMATGKPGALNSSPVCAENKEVTLQDITNESVAIVREEAAAVGKGISSTAQGVVHTSAKVNETLLTAGQGLQTLNPVNVPLAAQKLQNEALAIQRLGSSTAAGALASTAGVTQTLLSTTQNIGAVDSVVSSVGITQNPEETVDKLKAETEVVAETAKEEAGKMAANVTATAGAATSKAKEGVQAAQRKSGGIIQIGVRLIRLVVRVANKGKKKQGADPAPGPAPSGSSQTAAPTSGASAPKETQPLAGASGGADSVAGMAAMAGSLASGAGDASKNPTSAVKTVVGLVVKVVRMVKRSKGGGTPAEVRASVISLNEDGQSIYYDCDEELATAMSFPGKATSVSTVGTQTAELQELSEKDFILRAEFEELKQALSMGAVPDSGYHKNMPGAPRDPDPSTSRSLWEVAGNEYSQHRRETVIQRCNTTPDIRRAAKTVNSYESSSTLPLTEEDIKRLQSACFSVPERGNTIDRRSLPDSHSTRDSYHDMKLLREDSNSQELSNFSKISLSVAPPLTSSVEAHPGYQGNRDDRYGSVDLNAAVVLHPPPSRHSQSFSVSDPAVRRKSNFAVGSPTDRVTVRSFGRAPSKHPARVPDSNNVPPQQLKKSASLDIEKQSVSKPIRSLSTNGYAASSSEGTDLSVSRDDRLTCGSAASVHFLDEQPVDMRSVKQATGEVRLSKCRYDDRVNASQPNLSYKRAKPASVVVDIPGPSSVTGYYDNAPGREHGHQFSEYLDSRRHERGKWHRQSKTKRQDHLRGKKHLDDAQQNFYGQREPSYGGTEDYREQENFTTGNYPDKSSDVNLLGSCDIIHTKTSRSSARETAGKKPKRLHEKHRSSKRKKSFSRGSKRERLKQGGEHPSATSRVQNSVSEGAQSGRGKVVMDESEGNDRYLRTWVSSRMPAKLGPSHNLPSDNAGGESSRETSDDCEPYYDSTDYI